MGSPALRAPSFLKGQRPFIIAEAGVNHNGRADLALKLVDAAADAGADAIKFQTFRAEALAIRSAPKCAYQERDASASQFEMLKRLEFTEEAHRRVLKHCRARGIGFLSTPFDEKSADFLESLGMGIFKIPSGEVTNHPLLSHIAGKRKPVILSTGMSTLTEVRAAVKVLAVGGCRELAVLHCVSSYPAPVKDVNLKVLATLARALRLPVGYSDHTLGIEISVAAAALGAVIIEKHFTLDKTLPGPDHAMSLEPEELKSLCAALRRTVAALGDGVKTCRPSERETRMVARRSIVAAGPLAAGARLSRSDLAFKRPGTGIAPSELGAVLGKKLRRNLAADEFVTKNNLLR